MIEFYQVSTNSKNLSFSPFVIATELFLKHKNLDWNAKLMGYCEVKPTINKVTDGKWDYVPTLKFPNGDIVYDTLKIAEYLDEKYPDSPLLNNDPKLDELVQHYRQNCTMSVGKLSLADLLAHMDEANKAYFIEKRMSTIETTEEDLGSNKEENIASYFDNLKPLIEHLNKNKFIDGDKPLIHDYLLISAIQMFKTVSPTTYEELIINNPNEVFKNWVESMERLFDGFLKNRKTVK